MTENKKTYKYINSDVTIDVNSIIPENPKFAVQIIHGVSEHNGRYSSLMRYIAENGGIAVAHNQPGHGDTAFFDKKIGMIDRYYYNFNEFVADTECSYVSNFLESSDYGDEDEDDTSAEQYIKSILTSRQIPRYILGFSMGAMEAALYAARHSDNIAGCILSGLPKHEPFVSPALLGLQLMSLIFGDDYHSVWLNKLALRKYNKFFSPEPESDGKFLWLSSDIENRTAFESDPLCNNSRPVILYKYLLKLVRDVYRPSSYDTPRKDFPILIMSGEFDPVSGGNKNVLYAEQFLRDMGFSDIRTIMYKNMRHEIFNDFNREYPMRDLIDFCLSHIDSEKEKITIEQSVYKQLFTNSEN